MTDPTLVDVLGMIASGVWISGALYFQLIREGDVHPAYVVGLLLIGVALMMVSSAVAIPGRTTTIQVLGILANGLFTLLGIGVWYSLEKHICIEETKALAENHNRNSH